MKKNLLLVMLLLAFVFGLSPGLARGKTTLVAGDIAIFGVNTDTPKDFGFVLLVDIEAGTEIRFTDSGWSTSTNTFRGNEGAVKYTAPSALPSGTVITWAGNSSDFTSDNDSYVGTNGFNLSASGDQVIAFQGTSDAPTFIYAVETNSNVWQDDVSSSNDSGLPDGLTNGVNAVAVGAGSGSGDEYDDAAYNKSTMSGTASELLAAISDNSKWEGNNSTVYDLTSYSFTVNSSGGGVNNPSAFTATASSDTQIDLSWTQNSSSDNVMVAYSSDGTFGTPSSGTAYAASDGITGGGTVIYNGSATSFNHTSLTSGTHYYYKAWSVNGSKNYSSGVTGDATTYKNSPSNQATFFAAGTPTSTTIPLTWSDNDGAVVADGYLIMASTTNSFTDPVDGVAQADKTDLSGGSGQVNVVHGTQAYTFTGLYPGDTYYFKIWAYTNSGSAINYKTDGTVPTANAAISSANTHLIISKVADPSDNVNARFVELYNPGSQTVDFGTTDWYLVKQVNGGTMYSIHLSGSIATSGSYVVAFNMSDFNSAHGFDPDQVNTNINGNGDDGYYLYYGGDKNTGALIDAYGVLGEDGTGKDWEYTDSKAVRNTSVTSPNTTWTASEWTITSAATTDMIPGTYRDCITWNGSTSTDMTATGNWGGGVAPTSSSIVKIPSGVTNAPAVNTDPSSPETFTTLVVNSGASLTINPGKALTVSGDITNNGTLTLASDATGNGSLIVNGAPTGDVTEEHYVAAYTSGSDGWHLVSVPFDADPAGTNFDPTSYSTNNDLYSWNEGTYTWDNYRANTFTFSRGNGYLIAQENNTTNSVTGTLNNADVTFVNLSYAADHDKGWNLLGNPFTSALTWGSGNWSLSNVGGVAKIWSNDGGTYLDVNSGDIIPVTSGFFVQVTSSTNSITIPAADRIHDGTNNYKSSKATMNKALKFKITNDANSYYDQGTFGFKDNATEGYDLAFDSHKLFSMVNTAPQLWTVSDNQDFSTNYIPQPDGSASIPVDFKAGVNSDYHISWSGIDNIPDGMDLTLDDLQKNISVNMRDVSEYDFSATTDDDNGRFVLHINGTTGIQQMTASDKVTVYVNSKNIYVKAKDNNLLTGTLNVTNLLGQTVFRSPLNGTMQQILQTQLNTGVYIVHLKMKDGTISSQKVVIQ